MKYLYLDTNTQEDSIASAILQRESEHHGYELNRLAYLGILKSLELLPKQWPVSIAQFKGVQGEQLAAALSGDDYKLACDLQFRDRVELLLKTTNAEQSKCENVYASLLAMIPDAVKRDAAVARVKAKQALAKV